MINIEIITANQQRFDVISVLANLILIPMIEFLQFFYFTIIVNLEIKSTTVATILETFWYFVYAIVYDSTFVVESLSRVEKIEDFPNLKFKLIVFKTL